MGRSARGSLRLRMMTVKTTVVMMIIPGANNPGLHPIRTFE